MNKLLNIISNDEGLIEQVTEQVRKRRVIKNFCKTSRAAAEIMKHLGLKHREHYRSKVLQPLLVEGVLAQTMPDALKRLKSPKQMYYFTDDDT